MTAASVVVGHGLRRLCGYDTFSPTAAPIGLASLIVLASLGVALPGHAVTAFALVALAIVGSLAAVGSIERGIDAVGAGALALAAGCIPFAASGRVGILGVTDNADLVGHLVLADAVGHGRDPVGLDAGWWPAYPTGPHSLATALSRGLGLRLDAVFEGLLLAAVAVAALGALAALRHLPRARRIGGAVLAALPFLVASYFIQSSFKEPLEVAFLFGWALALPEAFEHVGARRRAVVPLAVLAAGCFATFSTVGLVWPAAVAAAWLGLRLARDGTAFVRQVPPRRGLEALGVLVIGTAAAAFSQFDRASKFFGGVKATVGGTTTGGNVRADVPAYEVSGIWPDADFRTLGPHPTMSRALGIAGMAVAAWAGLWCWRRRNLEPLALAVGAVALYAPARVLATPYYGAKALTIAAAGVMLMTVVAVLSALPGAGQRTRMSVVRFAGICIGVAFLALAVWSSAVALRSGRVAPAQHEQELASFRATVRGQPTLYMGENDYIAWYLRGAKLAFPYSYLGSSQVPVMRRPEKPWTISRPFDFDSLDPAGLDQFRYVIGTRAAYASAPPANFHVIRRTPSYALYERRGPTAPRAVLAEDAKPGAGLDCEASRPTGSVAAVIPTPAVVGPAAWRLGAGPAPRGQYGFVGVETGAAVTSRVSIPAGTYELSLQYVSPTSVTAEAAGTRLRVPPSLEGAGTYWRVGRIRSTGGPVDVRVFADKTSRLARFRSALFGKLAFTRVGAEQVVPMARACGRYVDWYRPL